MHALIYLLAAICVAPSFVSAETVNTTDNNYELPTRIGVRERDDDREPDIDPTEMEGMTAALAKQFAEKIVHKMNQEEEILRAHESSSSSAASSGCGAMYLLTTLLTFFFSSGNELPKVPSDKRSIPKYFITAALVVTFGILVSLVPASTAFHHQLTLSSCHQTSFARRQLFLNDCAYVTEQGGDYTTVHVPDPSRRSAASAVVASVFGSLCIFRRAEAAYAETVGKGTGAGGSDELYLAQPLGPPGTDGKLSRPYAPVEFLVPAARVGLYIYETFAVAEEITKLQQKSDGGKDSATNMQNLWAKLDRLILSPPSFIKSTDPKVSRSDAYGGAPPILGELSMAAQKRRERREQSIDADLASELFEPGQLIGERRSWKQLQKAEMKREAASEVRRALNIYTTNLNFNRNKYSFKGSAEEKSALIRNDRLPTANDVIRSDLDSRDLFRNEMQTALEDATAEFIFIKKECGGDVSKAELTELVSLLRAAKDAIDKWFGFIEGGDVEAALAVVQREAEA